MLLDIRNTSKRYGPTQALREINLQIESGEIVGLFGPNGAGKTTLLRALLGLAEVQGEILVAGLNPKVQATQLMNEVSFIADTAILPRWMRVQDCLDFVANIHSKFSIELAHAYLAKTDIQLRSKISQLSKGMITQLHLSIVMSIDSSLLVLDEPTLGLDIVYRKNFYRDLLDNYFDKQKTILITTHQIEEVEDLLTRVVFINRGEIILDCKAEHIPERFAELRVTRGQEQAARELEPMYFSSGLEGDTCWFADKDTEKLQEIGQLKTPKLADLFVARVMEEKSKAGGKK